MSNTLAGDTDDLEALFDSIVSAAPPAAPEPAAVKAVTLTAVTAPAASEETISVSGSILFFVKIKVTEMYV